MDLQEYEAEAVTSLVKLYLRELPENILTSALAPKFNELSGIHLQWIPFVSNLKFLKLKFFRSCTCSRVFCENWKLAMVGII